MKYKIIYADPAWVYADKGHAGKRGVEYKYKTMKDEDIMSLPVNDIGDDNSALLLWVTYPKLDIGLETMKRWGYSYKTVAFSWIKQNKIADTFFMGGGSYTRANPEICLLGFKGKPLKRISKSVRQLIVSHLKQHSKKPDEARDRIVELFGDLPRIELFARHKFVGWDAIGKDIDGLDIRDAINIIINKD